MKLQIASKQIGPNKKGFTYIYLVLFFLLYGCSSLEKPPQQPVKNTFFEFTRASGGDTYESLAQKHLGDIRHAARIKEINGLDKVEANKEIIIPKYNVRPGGLTAKGYQLVPVLAYHHFSRANSTKRMIVGKRKFEEQLRFLRDNDYSGITIDQFFEFLDFGQIPEKSVLITVDDGWESTYSIAYPLLKKYNFPAVLYIPTNHIQERAGKFLSWGQIREMLNDETVDIQPHTKTHRDLTKRQQSESFSTYINAIRSELSGAKRVISNKLGHETTSLSYPYGATNSFVSALAKAEGYTTAFTVQRDGNPFFQNNFNLNRAMIFGGHNEREFVRNIDTFHALELETSEPIDESLNLARLKFHNPEHYENQGLWRTARITWMLYRDWLVSELNQKIANQIDVSAEEYEKIEQVDKKIMALSEKLQNIASEHFNTALATQDQDNRLKSLLLTLLYDPKHTDALQNLKHLDHRFRMLEYTVKPNDSLRKIARSIYGVEQKHVLIPIFNKEIQSDHDLKPGSVLALPQKPKKEIVRTPAPVNQNRCGPANNANKSKQELSQEYYTAAMRQFNSGETANAISSLNISLCFDPGNQEAQDMKELLDSLLN